MTRIRWIFLGVLLSISPLTLAHVGSHQDLSLSATLLHFVTQTEHVLFLVLAVMFGLSIYRLRSHKRTRTGKNGRE